MQPQEPKHPETPDNPADLESEALDIEALGVGRDMSAGSPENWQVSHAGAGAEASEAGAAPLADALPDHDPEKFNVKLEVFEGPLELLLHLVREHKLDIHDIPIAFITEQYLKYVDILRQLNIDLASEYLVMASYLVYIKSRTLLPQTDDGEIEEEDPEVLRQELQRQLIEYQKFKRISQAFRHAEEEQSWLYTRGGNGDGIMLDPDDGADPPLAVTVFDLISAIQHMIEAAGEEGIHLVEIDELEVADRKTLLLETLENAGHEGVIFQSLFEGARVLEIVVTFLALLELIKGNLIVAAQGSIFGELRIMKAVKDD